MQKGFKGEKQYKLEVVEDGERAKGYSVTTECSKVSESADKKETISEARDIYVNVPSGTHSYRI